MRQRSIVRRRADDDIESAIFYNLEEAGAQVAAELINRLEEALNNISGQPGIGSPRYGQELRIPGLALRESDSDRGWIVI